MKAEHEEVAREVREALTHASGSNKIAKIMKNITRGRSEKLNKKRERKTKKIIIICTFQP